MRRSGVWFVCRVSILTLTLAFTLGGMEAQVRSFRHFGLDKSIFPSRIECIDQAKSGELLIGTLAGLVTYDGYNFKTFGTTDGLAENSISSIYVSEDEIWLGHWAGNLSKYDADRGTIEVYDLARSLNFSSITRITSLHSREIMLLTREGKVFSLIDEKPERLMLPLAFENEKVVDLFERDGFLYVVLESQVISLDAKNPSSPWLVELRRPERDLRTAMAQENGEWLVGTTFGAFKCVSGICDQLITGTEGYSIVKSALDTEQTHWMATEDEGLLKVNLRENKATCIKRENGLSYNQVRSVFVDREGILWVGTSAGLDQFLGEAFTLFDQRSGLPSSLVWDVAMVGTDIFALTSKGIVSGHFNRQNGNMVISQTYEIQGEPKQLVYNGANTVFVLDHEGKVWKNDLSENVFKRAGLIDEFITCLEMVNGALWLGTSEGIMVLSDQRPTEHLTIETGLAGNQISGIYYSKVNNETWITALGSETTLYREGKFRAYGSAEGLNSHVVQDAAFDAAGNIWFATYDKGVFYFDNNAFRSLSETVELTSNTTFAIESDDKGRIWIGHNWGVDVYDITKQSLTWFGEDDGFMGVEVNPGAAFYSEQTGLWLGTLMGVLRFDPEKITTNSIAPTLRIRAASIGVYDLLKSPDGSGKLNIDSDLSVDFQSVSLMNPEKNKFQYRLIGAHENWKTLTEPQLIEYLSLPAGKFSFELRACNNSGICSPEPVQLFFSLTPPFYRTWWFYTLLFLIIVGAIFIMDRYRVVALMEQKQHIQERLSRAEQELIDADQERNLLASQLQFNNNLVTTLENRDAEKSNRAKEVLMHFNAYQLHKEEVGSDAVFTYFGKDYRLVLIVEVGVSGVAAHSIKASLRHALEDQMPQTFDHANIIKEWKIIVRSLENCFTKFRGIHWLMCIDAGSERWYCKSGLRAFTFSDVSVDEVGVEASPEINTPVKMELECFQVSSTLGIFVCSASLFEQLNESGTKSLSRSKLKELIKPQRHTDQLALSNFVLDYIKSWKGGMEQFEDIVFYIWNYE